MTTELPNATNEGMRTTRSLHVRLAVMMFLQYFVQGAYLPILPKYLESGLGYTTDQLAIFIGAMSIGPLVAPFIIGQLVDRHFASQKVLAACHFLSGAIMIALFCLVKYTQTSFAVIVAFAAVYAALYTPSMFVSNSLAFHHLKDRERDFPLVRLFGTIGFIVPAWLIEPLFLRGLEGTELNFARSVVLAVSGISGLVMGAYALTLPNTPALKQEKTLAPGKVIGLLRQRDFLVLVGLSLILAVAHKFFFFWNSQYLSDILIKGDVKGAYEQRISSIGQVFEILVMIVLGLFIKRFGFKKTMLIGAAAYSIRCLILAYAITLEEAFRMAIGLVCVGQALHGVCFACFLATAYMYVDRISPPDIRGSMQNFFGTLIIGLGFFVGSFVSGNVGKLFTSEPVETAEMTKTAVSNEQEQSAAKASVPKPTAVDKSVVPNLEIRSALGIESKAGVTRFVKNKPDGSQEVRYRDWPGVWLSGAVIALMGLIGLAVLFPKDTPIASGQVADNTNEPDSGA